MNRNTLTIFFIIIVSGGLFVLLNLQSLPSPNKKNSSVEDFSALTPIVTVTTVPTTQPPVPTFAPVTLLKIEDLKPGMGTSVASGSSVAVNYIGRLTNGQVFDTSLSQGRQPLTFQVGAGQVIKGWEEGIIGMKIGGQRRLIIPPDKAYGSNGFPPTIPPNATLIFEIEILDVK